MAYFQKFNIFGFARTSERMFVFIKNVSITMAATFYTAFCFFLIKIVAARTIGPLEYGRFLLILSAGQILMIPILLGLNNSLIKNYKEEGKNRAMLPYYLLLIFSSIIWTGLYFLLKGFLSVFLKLPLDIFILSVFYGVILGLKLLSEGALKAQKKFKLSAIIDAGTTTIFVVLTVLFFVFGQRSYLLLVYPVLAAYFLYTLLVIAENRKHFGFVGEPSLYKDILGYAFWVMSIFSVSTLFLNSDKLLINYFFNESVVGVFGAHLVAATALWLQLCTTFVSVFFPMVVNLQRKQQINKKLNRLGLIFFLPYCFSVYLFGVLIMKLFGAKYPLNNLLLLLLSFNVVLFSFVQVKNWLVASQGLKDIKRIAFYWLISYFIYVVLILLLIRFLSFYVIVLSAILINIMLLILFERRSRALELIA